MLEFHEMQSRTVGPLKVVSFPPQDLRLEVDLLDGRATRPETAAQVIDRIRPDAICAGPMFEFFQSGSNYATYDIARLIYRYLDVQSSVNVASSYPTRGGTISVVGNVAAFNRGDGIQPGSTVAIQGYPSLVEEGRNVANASIDTHAEGRCAVGILNTGEVFFALATLGMYEFARQLIAAGAMWAIYTDGGGSATLFAKNAFSIGLSARRLPCYLMAIRPTSEAIIDGIHDTTNKIVGGAVNAVVSPLKTLIPFAIVGGIAYIFLRDD